MQTKVVKWEKYEGNKQKRKQIHNLVLEGSANEMRNLFVLISVNFSAEIFSVLSYQTSKWAWGRIISSSCFLLYPLCTYQSYLSSLLMRIKQYHLFLNNIILQRRYRRRNKSGKRKNNKKTNQKRENKKKQLALLKSRVLCNSFKIFTRKYIYEARTKTDYRNIIDTTLINFRQELASG